MSNNGAPDQSENEFPSVTPLTQEECLIVFNFLSKERTQDIEALKAIPQCSERIGRIKLRDEEERIIAFGERLMDSLFLEIMREAEQGFKNTAERLIIDIEVPERIDQTLVSALIGLDINPQLETQTIVEDERKLMQVLADQSIWTGDLCTVNAGRKWKDQVERAKKEDPEDVDPILTPMREFLSHYILTERRGVVEEEQVQAGKVMDFVLNTILGNIDYDGIILHSGNILKAISATQLNTLIDKMSAGRENLRDAMRIDYFTGKIREQAELIAQGLDEESF